MRPENNQNNKDENKEFAGDPDNNCVLENEINSGESIESIELVQAEDESSESQCFNHEMSQEISEEQSLIDQLTTENTDIQHAEQSSLEENVLEDTVSENVGLDKVNNESSEMKKHIDAIAETIKAGFLKIHDDFEHKIAYDLTKQRQIDSLHSELQQYKTNLIAKTNRPLINGMILLHDDMGSWLVSFKPLNQKR